MNEPLINKAVFDIGIETSANKAKEESNMLFENHVRSALERVMRRFDNFDVEIDRPLNIDLGKVSEGELAYRVENALYDAISTLLSNRERAQFFYQPDTKERDNGIELFFDYLLQPAIPWVYRGGDTFDFEWFFSESMGQIMSSESYVERLTNLVTSKPDICQRFFSSPFKHEDFKALLHILDNKLKNREMSLFVELVDLIDQSNNRNVQTLNPLSSYVISRILFGSMQEVRQCFCVAVLELLNLGLVSKEAINKWIGDKRPPTGLDVVSSFSSEQSVELESKQVKDLPKRVGSDNLLQSRQDGHVGASVGGMNSDIQRLELLVESYDKMTSQIEDVKQELDQLIRSQNHQNHRQNHPQRREEGKFNKEDWEEEYYNRLAEIEKKIRAIVDSFDFGNDGLLSRDEDNLDFELEVLNENGKASDVLPDILLAPKEQASGEVNKNSEESIKEPVHNTFNDFSNSRASVLSTEKQKEAKEKTSGIVGRTSEVNDNVPVTKNESRSVESNMMDSFASIIETRNLIKAVDSILQQDNAKKPHDKERKSTAKSQLVTILRKQPELKDRIPVSNAGLVILQPYLISFFDRLGLLEKRREFKSIESQIHAAYLLHALTGSKELPFDHEMILNKLICGINIFFPLDSNVNIIESEQKEINSLLRAVINNWKIIKNTSISGLQESFLRRKGVLEKSENDWILRVEARGIDVLLEDIPWDIHFLSFPWNDYFIHVEWNTI